MSDRTPFLFAGAAASVLLLGAILYTSMAAEPVPGASVDVPATAASATAQSLEERVAALEQEVSALRAELAERPRRKRGRGGAGLAADDEELARRIGRASVVGGDGKEALIEALDEGDPEVEGRLSALVRDELEAERDAEWDRRRERRSERSRERIDELASQVGLDASQVEFLNETLEAERDQIFPLFRAAREDGTFREAREQAEAIRAETDEKVAGTLAGEQLEAWQELREEQSRRRR